MNSIQQYEKCENLGQGTYGKVYRGINKLTHEIVAIKEIILSEDEKKEGIQSTTLREMSVLLQFRKHPHIVELKQVILDDIDYKQYLIMEYIDTDLRKMIDQKKLTEHIAKKLLLHILRGLYALHSQLIFHRDLKPANILVQNGVAKLGDFGLAKPIGYPINRTHTKEVQTLWYRAPELLLGHFKYSPALDIFSLGCIFYEMLIGEPLFKGNSEIDQLFKIFQFMGTPLDWEGFKSMPYYSPKFPQFKSEADIHLSNCNISQEAKNLLLQMLQIDSTKRITAKEAINDIYFSII
ncbi:unnamed protein product [Paramecium sonneborni]|uniref:Cyclin-dependent kinase 2 homolog n=1 Tax=Paramecium sonneborni TaxID=65129 RepID=A0A8S1QI38_9CILI|nr:unnamed protein product [Paramecium sonneborni]